MRLLSFVLTVWATTATSYGSTLLFCPNSVNTNVSGINATNSYVPGTMDGTCGTNSAVQMFIPTDTDYDRIEWTSTGLDLDDISTADASVNFIASSQGDQPYYMISFSAPGVSLGQSNSGDQILLIEFQPTTLSGGQMVLDPNTTLFNVYDNTTGVYLQGGQQNAHTLNYWLTQFPQLAGVSVAGLRIGEGLAGGSCADCSETLTINGLDVTTTSQAPEPASFFMAGGALALLWVGRKRFKTR